MMTSASDPTPHVMVFGTRTFDDYDLLESRLDRLTADLGRVVVCTGEWRGIGIGTPAYVGADLLAEKWAARRRFVIKRFPPPFDTCPNTKQGRVAAFHMRNREMVEFIAGLGEWGFAVGFWDGSSPGSEEVIGLLRKHKVTHKVVRYEEAS